MFRSLAGCEVAAAIADNRMRRSSHGTHRHDHLLQDGQGKDWQGELRSAHQRRQDIKKAREFFPELRDKITLWNADALLIAEYGRRRLAQMSGSKRKRTA